VSSEIDDLYLAERALGHLRGEGQVLVSGERSLVLRFARSAPTQATGVDDTSVTFLSLRDGHVGTATTNLLSDDDLRDAARRAMAVAATTARAAGNPGGYPGLPQVTAPVSDHHGFDETTAALDAATGGDALRTIFAVTAEPGLEAFGVWTAGVVRTTIAASTGLRSHEAVTDAHLKVIARDADGRSGWGAQSSVAVGDIDAAAVARGAVAKLGIGHATALAPGAYPVVLAPDAVGGLLAMLGDLAFNGLAHAEGRGALEGRIGTRVAAPRINLSDSPRHALTWPRSFDPEGVPKVELPLIGDGIARHVVHDQRSAARAGDGAVSTGHALAPGGSPFGPSPMNLVLEGGSARDEAALIAPIERGLYVTRLWYLNVVHPTRTLVTGTTRDGTFLIEDGEIAGPAIDVRITDSVLRILDETEDLGAGTSLVTEAEHYGRRFAHGVVCPALRTRGLRVTG
jgi:PmbA protein